MTTKSGKKSESKEETSKKDVLAKLVSFNETDETEIKIVGTKKKKQPAQSQMTMMKYSIGKKSCFLDAEQHTISVTRWFVRITSLVPLVKLDNPCSLIMLKEKVPIRDCGSKHPKLSQLSTKKHLDSECELMTTEIKKVIEIKLVESKGVQFGKFNHDGVNSTMGTKWQSFGFQFVKINFEKNLVLCLGCKHCGDNTEKGVAALLDATSTEVTGKANDNIVSLMKSDGVAIGIYRVLEIEDDEGYCTHDGDKIGCVEIGRLTHSKNKVIINAFEYFQKLIEKFLKIGKHFSKSSKNTMRFEETKKKHVDTIPSKNITVDLNTTRIAAVRIIIDDCLRMKKGIQHYALDFDIASSCWHAVAD